VAKLGIGLLSKLDQLANFFEPAGELGLFRHGYAVQRRRERLHSTRHGASVLRVNSITLAGGAIYKVRRPDAFFIDLALPSMAAQYVYDGKTVTVFDGRTGQLYVAFDFVRDPPKAKLREKAETHLYRGQCNWPYWHGVFGGMYLPHLRSALYR
jgi:hypothetical protein